MQLFKTNRELENELLIELNNEINDIINNSSEDIRRINFILELLICFKYYDTSEAFNKLNTYYSSLENNSSKHYELKYRKVTRKNERIVK